MIRSKLIVLCLILSIIILTINFALTNAIMPKESFAKSEEKQIIQWDWTYGGVEGDGAYTLIQTTDGGFALAGDTLSFGAGDIDMWFVKTDVNGVVQWNKTYGETGVDWVWALFQTTDGGFLLAGYTDSYGAGEADMWLVKTDTYGVEEWNQTYGGPKRDWACALLQTADGGFALAGDTMSFGAGSLDMWLVKTDVYGVEEWNQTYGGTKPDGSRALIQTADGGFALAGYTDSYGTGEADMWLVKTNVNGVVQWNKTYGGLERDSASSLIQTADGGFTLAGDTMSFGTGSLDMWLVKTDANGGEEWNQTYGGTKPEGARALIQTDDYGFTLAGYTESYGAGNGDMWLVKTDANGGEQWSKTHGGTGFDDIYALIQTNDRNFALAGYTDSYGAGDTDMWLVKTGTVNVRIPRIEILPFFITAIVLTSWYKRKRRIK